MKKLILLMLFVLPLSLAAQTNSANWDGLYSYFNIKDIDAGNGKVFAASENAVFTTDISSGDQTKISTLNGLSGETISALDYLPESDLLLIGYENGLIQIYDLNNQKTFSLIDIRQKPTISPNKKRINDFYAYNGKVYISTNYGISAFDPERKEFGDTYFIGNNGDQLGVNAVAVLNNRLYAATHGGGVRSINLNNPGIVDFSQWQQTGSGDFQNLVAFNNAIYVITNSNDLKKLNGNAFAQVHHFNQAVQDIKTNADQLTVTLNNHVVVFDQQLNTIGSFGTNQFQADLSTGLAYQGSLYIGDKNRGLLKSGLNNSLQIEYLSPNGPLRNDAYAMDLVAGRLWVAYGEMSFYYNPYPLRKRGISKFSSGHWMNIPYSDLPEDRSIISVTINPNNPGQVFFCSYHDGLLEINDDQVANFYDAVNSGLDPSDNPNETPEAMRIGPAAFDSEGNLWFANAFSANGLIELPKGGGGNDFIKYDISDMIDNPAYNNGFGGIVIGPRGNVFLASYDDGVVGYNPSTHDWAKVKGGGNQGNLPVNYISCIALDHNDQLWIGTSRGLRVLFGPAGMFNNPNMQTHNIVFLDENGVAQELFAGTPVTAIEVDGNNNKWVGTTAGVYYVSADGQKTFHHFTKENSPLPSNDINSIKIDGNNGKVYIATENGLVAFHGRATSPADNLDNVHAYPNPVRPNYYGAVTVDGLMKNADVKITDISGNLVFEKVSEGGSIQWDTTAFGKYKVASGVYFIMVTTEDQTKTKVAKIMIIR